MSIPPFQALLDAHAEDVWRYLVASVGRSAADDCFQETFLSALRAYPKVGDDSNLRGWLFTIAHRKVVDLWRARQRQPVPVGAVPDREDASISTDTTDEAGLWADVQALPDKQREVVTLRYVGDLPYADIASLMGCSEAAARQSAKAGLAKLRERRKETGIGG